MNKLTNRYFGTVIIMAIYLFAASDIYSSDDSVSTSPCFIYSLEGNFFDSGKSRINLKPQKDGQSFSFDDHLKETATEVWGPSRRDYASGAQTSRLSLDPSNGYTMCAFFKQDKNAYSMGGTLFGFGSEKWGEPGFLVSIPYGVITIKASSGKNLQYKRLTPGRWHHIALTLPASANKSDSFILYIDGDAVMSGPVDYKQIPKQFRVANFSGDDTEGLWMADVKLFSKTLSKNAILAESRKHGTVEQEQTQGETHQLTTDFSRRHQFPENKVPVIGEIRVHFLTRDWICVIGDYNEFIKKRFLVECGEFLGEIDARRDSIASWSYNFHYNFAIAETVAHYRPVILRKFETSKSFSISQDGTPASIIKNSYWINAIGQMRVNTIQNKTPKTVNMADVAHFAFLKISPSFRNGQSCTVSTMNGEKISFRYDENNNVSQAIKVNQVGYLPGAGRKYAYLGAWLGHGGALDLSAWEGKPFHLINHADNSTAFSGQIALRMKESDKPGIPWTGEDVYEMDFSKFQTVGDYHILVPGIGISWPFKISNDALGETFYIHTRGLYHKRCGIAKEAPYTNWPHAECHTNTYQGGFPPNSSHYAKQDASENWGIFDEHGKHAAVKHFTVVRETKTDKLLPDVRGGWHDAADYDRRTHHFEIVRDLLSAYLMFPDNFTDGQLNIPESGNGIPDIIDEAAWGVEVWRLAQNAKGGVGCWIEADSHPKTGNPGKDSQRYYLALPTRESTIEYASSAALLAFAYKQCGAIQQSELYKASAILAYEYAMEPANQIDVTWKHLLNPEEKDENKKIYADYRYTAPLTLPAERCFKAACALFLLTGEARFLQEIRRQETEFKRAVADMHWRLTPFYFIELLYLTETIPDLFLNLRDRVLKLADEGLSWQEQYAYRNLWWPPNHAYATHLSWGNFLPLRKSRIFIVAYYLTGDSKYRDAALLCNDWQNGANPMGRSLTSGLGQVYPARFLDLPSYSDGIAESIPGITPYYLTYGMAYQERTLVHGLYLEPRKDHGFSGIATALLPSKLHEGKNITIHELTRILDKTYPIWRRFCNVELLAVPQNEFTVWETIGPSAAISGCLMEKGWMPSDEIKNRKPCSNIKRLHGYIAQP